jgi:hypothetical protein
MSDNITLHASCLATLHLKDGTVADHTIEEKIRLWLTPTVVTNAILALDSHEERLAAYKDWALKTATAPAGGELSDPSGPTLRILGEVHVEELEKVLKKYTGWFFEWSWE